MTKPLSQAVIRFRHLSPLGLDACRSALATPRFWDYQYRSNREGASNTFTLEVVTDSASQRREVLSLLAPILNGIGGLEMEHIQEYQDPEYPRRFSPQQFEEMRQALTPRRFQEEYQVSLEAPDTREVDRAFRQIERGLEQVDRFLRGRSLEQWHQLEEIRRSSNQLHRVIVTGGRQYGRQEAIDAIRYSLDTLQRQTDRSCLTCAYFMNGYKTGELSICNAFHAIADNYTANSLENDCPDWESR